MAIWCGHEDCGKPFESDTEERPAICPVCRRPEAWTTDPGPAPVDEVRLKLTRDDRDFLRELRIQS